MLSVLEPSSVSGSASAATLVLKSGVPATNPVKWTRNTSPSASPAEQTTPKKAALSLDGEFTHAEEAPSDHEESDESGQLVIDESLRSERQKEADADGNWITASRNRRGARPRFKLAHFGDAASAYQTVSALEGEHPSLKMEVRPTFACEYIITPKDDESAAFLQRLAEEGTM